MMMCLAAVAICFLTVVQTAPSEVVQLYVMSRNEYPLIQSWVLYHGDRFGFENLHILDGSDDVKQIEFLKTMQVKYSDFYEI